ncbi:hypothetical protein L1049_007285 [Liquidambar formosana]|uniref:UPF0113 domain-containing protein n=1 Tax=Liquidambar formosana TaxID=63359 RepID=A0AAP0RIJ3_LIQFO
MSDVPLGFGVAAKSTQECDKMDPNGIVVLHQGDIGEYLRMEDKLLIVVLHKLSQTGTYNLSTVIFKLESRSHLSSYDYDIQESLSHLPSQHCDIRKSNENLNFFT